jgi:HD-GYP domain-containing protein (c-di-GMP phosphodiesterase class II)
MGKDPNVVAQPILAEARRMGRARMGRRERLAVGLSSALFLGGAAALWAVDPPHHVNLAALIWTLVVAVLANRVRFETPFGFTSATQLAFVPLALTLPPALVPIVACGALALAAMPDVLLGRLTPARLSWVFRNCSATLGPAWVLALAGHGSLPRALVLAAALTAQFVLDFVSFAIAMRTVRGGGLREQVRQAWVYVVDLALSCVGYLVALQTEHTPEAVLAVVPLLGLLAVFARERAGRLESLLELGETYRGTALLLGDVVSADDSYTGRHSLGVVHLALSVGDALGIDAERRRNLEFAALLHDVGKITIPKEIIHKPGELDPDEWRVVRTHSAEGQRMLARVGGFMTDVGGIVRAHHERWDGRGYPDGLLAEAAPLEARIITCCDSWSAMRTDRPYRRAMSYQAAINEVVSNIGTQFDPTVAGALLAVVGDSAQDASAAVAAGLDSLLST